MYKSTSAVSLQQQHPHHACTVCVYLATTHTPCMYYACVPVVVVAATTHTPCMYMCVPVVVVEQNVHSFIQITCLCAATRRPAWSTALTCVT